ncbi:MAG: lipoyl(octanoyl) transferase LipB [Mariprofundaceae bacterium]|nr:lipoyl(octanoyl) transferase LipB [Mariprofundaceae bacterium]
MPDAFEVIRHASQSYADSVNEQEARAAAIFAGDLPPCIILTEHPPLYTIGTSGSENDILSRRIDGETIAVFPSGRGGEVTYHGPGQLICYVLADLRHNQDLHKHVWRLEEMVIRTLADFGITSQRDKRGIGVWVDNNKGSVNKIAAVGVRCRKWITFHGIALNINPNLKHFSGIVPCGMTDTPVASMQAEGCNATREDVETCLLPHAKAFFGG